MKLHARPKRAARLARNNTGLDMNLVALIDIFTILIFFLMSSTGIEVLTNSRAVKLPTSVAEQAPRQTITVSVSETDIVVDGRKVADVAEALSLSDDLIPGLKAELDLLANRQVLGADKDGASKAVTIPGDKRIPTACCARSWPPAPGPALLEVAFAVQRKTLNMAPSPSLSAPDVSPGPACRGRRALPPHPHTVLAAVVLVCVVLLLSPAPVLDRAQPPELPARPAKLLVEEDFATAGAKSRSPQAHGGRQAREDACAPRRPRPRPRTFH